MSPRGRDGRPVHTFNVRSDIPIFVNLASKEGISDDPFGFVLCHRFSSRDGLRWYRRPRRR